jgi:hypothetical protein
MHFTIHDKINNIFNTAINNIYKNNKIKKSSISPINLILYKFLYAQEYTTKQEIVSTINYNNNSSFEASSYYRKENNISVVFYKNIFVDIQNLYFSICKDYNINNINNITKDDTKLIAIDGTYGNTNITRTKKTLQTTLFMSYFDINNQIPIDINCCLNSSNNEVNKADIWIQHFNNNNYEKYIIVADRAYFSYNFIKKVIR